MAGPFDYTIQTPDIFKNVAQGYEYGVALTQRERERQQQEMLAQQQAQEQARIRQIQQEYMNNPRPDTGAALRFLSTLPPEQAKIAAGLIEKMPAEVQKQNLGYGVQMLAATRAGDFATVKSIAQERAAAARNAGDENAARIFDFAAENAGKDPKRDERALLAGLVQYPGGVEAVNALGVAAKLPGEVRKGMAEAQTAEIIASTERDVRMAGVRNIQSQIDDRANRYNLDRDRLQSEVESKLMDLQNKGLSDSAQKIINDSAVKTVAAAQSAEQATTLAEKLEALGGGSGVASRVSEWIRQSTGNQDEMSAARSEYSRIRSSLVQGLLPPGPATDKDVALVMQGFPPDTADAAYVAKFLRSMARVQRAESAFEETKAEWVNSVGYLGKPRQDVQIGGVTVPAGTTLAQFWRKNGKQLIDDAQAQSALSKYSKYGKGQ